MIFDQKHRKHLRLKMKYIWSKFQQHFTQSFYTRRSAQKNTVKLSVFFELMGFARVKAASKMLMKLALGGNPIKEILFL